MRQLIASPLAGESRVRGLAEGHGRLLFYPITFAPSPGLAFGQASLSTARGEAY